MTGKKEECLREATLMSSCCIAAKNDRITSTAQSRKRGKTFADREQRRNDHVFVDVLQICAKAIYRWQKLIGPNSQEVRLERRCWCRRRWIFARKAGWCGQIEKRRWETLETRWRNPQYAKHFDGWYGCTRSCCSSLECSYHGWFANESLRQHRIQT